MWPDDNIKIDLKEPGCVAVGWIYLGQVMDECWAIVNTAMKLRIS